MPSSAIDLLDVNVWIALSIDEHDLHERANAYFQNDAALCLGFCRTSALGLVRVAMNPHTLGGFALSPPDAWRLYRQWREDPTVDLLEEPDGIDARLEGWIERGLVTRKLWTDAYLAAFAIAGGLRLVSFDRDFERFPAWTCSASSPAPRDPRPDAR